MNTLQAFTAGIAVGSAGAFGISVLIWQIPKAVRRFIDWRASHWTDADETEIRAFEDYVGGYNADTDELPVVKTEPEWVRPDEEEGSLIPRWRPLPLEPMQPFTGPPVTHIKDWISWNFGDWLANWSLNTYARQSQASGRHRVV